MEHRLSLIEGVFSAEEAREVLTNIFNSKINFHQLKNFSSQERDGKENEIASKRIPELKQCLKEIDQLTKEALKNNRKIVINSSVYISYSED